jgi:uncharacterized protein YbjT (DUF2867 family)
VLHHSGAEGKGKTVLVTGASGFVAAHVLNFFLSRGYNVRTTVRNDESAEKIKRSHKKYIELLSFSIVKDIAQPGALNEAAKGVDGVSSILSDKLIESLSADNDRSFI